MFRQNKKLLKLTAFLGLYLTCFPAAALADGWITASQKDIVSVEEQNLNAAFKKSAAPITVKGDLPETSMKNPIQGNYQDPQRRYRLESVNNGEATRFFNYVDGYSIVVPGQIAVNSINLSGLCSVITSPQMHIEVYREDFSNRGEIDSYLVYSYKGVDQAKADIKELKTMVKSNGRDVQVYLWHREKLNRIQNDRNYYTSLDIIDGLSVYNIIIKTEKPIAQCGGYESILDSFTTMSRSALGSNQTTPGTSAHAWNEETQEFYRTYFLEEGPLTWGLFEPSAPLNLKPLHVKEEELQYEFPVLLYYSHIHKNYREYPIAPVLEAAYNEGRVLELTLQTNSLYEAEEGNMVYQVLNGNYDAFLHQFAADVAAFAHPVMFRLGNEMNGDWCPYSAYHTSRDTSIYRAFYRYIYEIFRQENALANTIWIWNPNERAFPNYKWNYETLYYPGDQYVDVIGLTGYNTGTYYASVGETWRSFTEIYDPIYKKVLAYSAKPMMITEFGCSSIGGDKALWIEEMFRSLKNYPHLKMAVWWDGRDLAPNGEIARQYYINDSSEGIANFRKGFRGEFE